MMDNSESQKTDIDAMGQHDRKVRATKMNSTSSEQPTKSSITTSTDDGNPYPQPDDVWIAVMGMTGVGKSTFISLLAGYDIGIGHELQSSMSPLSFAKFVLIVTRSDSTCGFIQM